MFLQRLEIAELNGEKEKIKNGIFIILYIHSIVNDLASLMAFLMICKILTR